MKNMIRRLLTAALLGSPVLALAAPADYTHTVTFTPGSAGAEVLGFQNVSDDQDVEIKRIEVSHASTMTVTGGLMQYWVFASTAMTHSDAAGYTHSYRAALASLPAAVNVSTAPTSVTFEEDCPLFRPFVVNNDETATAQFSDVWAYDAEGANGPILLPKGSDRGIVFEQRRLGTADITAGTILVRILYTVR